jgi:hypothetical protein
MLVGEVRWASMSCGVVCRLSGGRWLSRGPDAALEVAPGVAGDGLQARASQARQGCIRRAGAGAAGQPGPQRRAAHSRHSAGQAGHRMRRGPRGGRSDQQQADRTAFASAGAAAAGHPVLRGPAPAAVVHCSRWRRLTAMRYSARAPMASSSMLALQQLANCHSAAMHGAQQVHGGLAVEVQLGHVVAAGHQAGHGAHQRPGREGRQHQRQRRPRGGRAAPPAPAAAAQRHPAPPASGAGCRPSSSG